MINISEINLICVSDWLAGEHETSSEHVDVDDMELGGIYLYQFWVVLRLHLDQRFMGDFRCVFDCRYSV